MWLAGYYGDITLRSGEQEYGLAGGWMTKRSEFQSRQRQRIFSPLRPDRPWDPTRLIAYGYGAFIPEGKVVGRGVKLTNHFRLLQRLRKHGTIHPLLHTPSHSSDKETSIFTSFGNWFHAVTFYTFYILHSYISM
jgi:hypothetical protein